MVLVDSCWFAADTGGCGAVEAFLSIILFMQQHQPSPAMEIKARLWL